MAIHRRDDTITAHGTMFEGDADVLEPASTDFVTPLPGSKPSNQQLDEVEHPDSYLSPSWISR